MANVEFGEDGRGNRFFKIGDWTRVTLVQAKNRDRDKDWSGCDVLRIQSYLNQESDRVMPGAEFPLEAPEDLDALLNALRDLVKAKGTGE